MCGPTHATGGAREPVLKQVDLPHGYYWRELYLPQLTTGASSLAFLPDGETLVYSMGGSLWRQRLGTGTAEELTHAAGAYDYQPDVDRSGATAVFTRYDGNSLELWRLDLSSGREQCLTRGGAVNVEPRLSPDGKRLAWVSTQGTGHFNLHIAMLDGAGLHDPRLLLGKRKSRLDRYYYSAHDHSINPSWSPDGKSLYYIGNPEIAWGTGDIWRVNVDHPAERHRVLREETNWSARPEPAPDGRRLLYSSYHGRQWQQLWLTTPEGAAPLPLTFGAYDCRNARWSPQGTRIAYVDNRDGNTALRVMDIPGGAIRSVQAIHRVTRLPRARLRLEIIDEHGTPTAARVTVLAADGRAYAPSDAWVHADDGFDRKRQAVETHYFHCTPPCTLELPAGNIRVQVQHGFAYAASQSEVRLTPDSETTVRVALVPQRLPAWCGNFISADLHIHMNYGGHYRNTPAHLAAQARAEDLDLACNLVVNKEQRVPDVAAFRTGLDPASTAQSSVLHGQEFHSSFWGHVGLLNLGDHLLLPGFAAYRHSAMASPYPTNAAVADLAHAQGALLGYAHPFDVLPDPEQDMALSHELPAGVIEGKVDYMEVLGFSDHRATATVWYRLLNLGFRLPAGAGSDTMANYASLHGPVGLSRVFLDTGGRRDPAAAMTALKAGHGFASNGPLLGLLLGDAKPGETLATPGRYRYRVALHSPIAIEHLELVQNGAVIQSFMLSGERDHLETEGTVDLAGGWALLRAWNAHADPAVLDLYPYATTNPVWIGDRVRAPGASADAAWFAAWLTRTLAVAAARDDYNTAEERRATLDYLRHARDAYLTMASTAAGSTPG